MLCSTSIWERNEFFGQLFAIEMHATGETTRFLLNQTLLIEQINRGEVLLDFLRQRLRLTGTRGACREGDCGSCMVLLGEIKNQTLCYRPANACLLPLGALYGRHIVTIEGINGSELNPIQQALVDAGAVQCGFCTPGLVMALTAYFINAGQADVVAALDAVGGNLCRCTGYSGIKRAIDHLCSSYQFAQADGQDSIAQLIAWRLLPPYFAAIDERLRSIPVSSKIAFDQQSIAVAGGTDLLVQQPEILRARQLDFVQQNTVWSGIDIDQRHCIIGAGTTIEDIRISPVLLSMFPSLSEDLKLVCSTSIRQQATVGGNLINASPIGDLCLFFLALDSRLTIADGPRQRELSLRDFFKGYKLVDLQRNERLIVIRFALPPVASRFSFEKISKRKHLDIASVNSAALIAVNERCIDNVHLSAGGVASVPLYLADTCAFLRGQSINANTIVAALEIMQGEIEPISDIRGSEAYKRLALRQLFIAHFIKLFPEWISWEELC